VASPRTDVAPPRESSRDVRLEPHRLLRPPGALGTGRPATRDESPRLLGPAPPLLRYAPGELPPGWGVPAAEPRNDLGVVALLLGIAAVLIGLIPRAFVVAYVIAVVAAAGGFFSVARVRSGVADNRRTAVAATLLGTAGLALSALGYVITR